MQLSDYRLLGSSGLRVSPLCLGAMTFGTGGGRSAGAEESRKMMAAYADAGGNFIDTANIYNYGASEQIVGEFIQGRREQTVLATKYSMGMTEAEPNASGNHRKNMMQAVNASLQRLATDYIDVYWMHVWEFRSPIDEVMRGLDDLVRQGKILYAAVSDAPAWKISEANTLARMRGWTPFIAMQAEYSLIERTPERDLLPMSAEHGLTVMPWSPLANGLLTGKYGHEDKGPPSAETMREGGRKGILQATGAINERNLGIIEVVKQVADEVDGTASQVALAWLLRQPGRPLPIVGASTVAQLEDNLGCLNLELSDDQLDRLAEVSKIEPGFPNRLYQSERLRSFLIDKNTRIEGGFDVKYPS